jgi:ribosomal protein S18 acetylase RimI-like enzyme
MTEAAAPALSLRREPRPGDPETVRRIVEETGFFRPEEVAIAVELVEERLAKGAASGYLFVFAERGGEAIGYACFGPVPLTVASWDLYWIAVRPAGQGQGVGRALLAACEEDVRRAGGRRIYVDTSTRPQYLPTRAFYRRTGYDLAAELADFYAPGDGKAIFCKAL